MPFIPARVNTIASYGRIALGAHQIPCPAACGGVIDYKKYIDKEDFSMSAAAAGNEETRRKEQFEDIAADMNTLTIAGKGMKSIQQGD